MTVPCKGGFWCSSAVTNSLRQATSFKPDSRSWLWRFGKFKFRRRLNEPHSDRYSLFVHGKQRHGCERCTRVFTGEQRFADADRHLSNRRGWRWFAYVCRSITFPDRRSNGRHNTEPEWQLPLRGRRRQRGFGGVLGGFKGLTDADRPISDGRYFSVEHRAEPLFQSLTPIAFAASFIAESLLFMFFRPRSSPSPLDPLLTHSAGKLRSNASPECAPRQTTPSNTAIVSNWIGRPCLQRFSAP